MVLRGEMTTTTTTRPERPKTLHNFALPNLKWGSQRHLKCMKIESTSSGSGGGSGDHRLRRRFPPMKFSSSSVSIPFRFGEEHRSNSQQHRRLRNAALKSVENGGEEEGIEEFRMKIMLDLKTVRDKITQSMFNKDGTMEEEEEEEEQDEESGQEKEREVEISPVKPWNLRKRRAVCKEPPVSANYMNQTKNGGFVSMEESIVTPSPSSRNDSTRVVKERGGVVEAETTKPLKLAVKLTKKEIEEDFMAFLGHRPPRRPKKRPRTVQKELDILHPAFYLTEATLDAYKVPEEIKRR